VLTGDECFAEIYKKVQEGLAGVEKQPENTEKYSSLDKGTSTRSQYVNRITVFTLIKLFQQNYRIYSTYLDTHND